MTSDQYAPAPSLQPARPTNILAIISLVASCVGFALPGVIMGHIALHQIKRTGEQGHGLALAGVIVGYCVCGITIILVVIWIVALLGFLAWGAANASTISNFG
ncbi:MAG: hypothetical protein QOH69_1710 [Actinomycetota bacterium]|nr:hypothetical protein [Actinomycetota bacterium]